MNIKISEVMSVNRGLHILKGERNKENLKNIGISKAFVLNYVDVAEYDFKNTDTIDDNIKENKQEIFVNLSKKFKNTRIQREDIILKLRANEYEAKLIYWSNRDREMNFVYSNDLIFMQKISEQIEPKFIFYLMKTNKIKKILKDKASENNSNKIRCVDVENIEIELLSIKEQLEIINQIEKCQNDLENLIK